MRRRMMMEVLQEMGRINIGQESPAGILSMFYALENGTAKTGEFTLSTNLPNKETLLISTGLSEIHGFMIVDADWYSGSTIYYRIVFNIWIIDANTIVTVLNHLNSGFYIDANYSQFTRKIIRIDGGDIYCDPSLSGSPDFTPFATNHRIVWVAW